MKYTLTTNHAASCYGLPILVDANNNAYGPADPLPSGGTARDFVERNKGVFKEGDELIDESTDPLDLFSVPAFTSAFLAQKY